MPTRLTAEELRLLVQRVFRPTPADRGLAIIVDVPDARLPDNPDWAERRELARDWYLALKGEAAALGLERVTLAWYRNAGGNNADLPETCHPDAVGVVPADVADLQGEGVPFAQVFADHGIVMAPTELSATAPLKVATRGGGFRAATMPGFLPSMVPALRLDYGEINRRVDLLAGWLTEAQGADFRFRVGDRHHALHLDLRHRGGHASGGLFPSNGVAGNLPSGEAYIVPYEGELADDPSGSSGELPVQIDGEVVLYRIENNRAVEVLSSGPVSGAEALRIVDEPAYANLSELGLGVLGDFGLAPTGSILLDEKLGLHIAFGRSDHFGGTVGPGDFTSPDAVIHLDRVYIPAMQPDIVVEDVTLSGPGGARLIIRNGEFVGL